MEHQEREIIRFESLRPPVVLMPSFPFHQVPGDAILRVKLYDKDENILRDDYIGDFYLPIGDGGETEHDILGRMGKKHGTFKLKVSHYPRVCSCTTCTIVSCCRALDYDPAYREGNEGRPLYFRWSVSL